MLLNTRGGPVTVKTTPAIVSAATKTYYYPAFSNDTIASCHLSGQSSSDGQPSNRTAGDQTGTIYPEKARLNFHLLLMNGARVIFTKAVAFNTILTIRTLII